MGCIMDHDKKTKHGGHRGSFSGRLGYILAVAGSALVISGVSRIWLQSMAAEFFCWCIFF